MYPNPTFAPGAGQGKPYPYQMDFPFLDADSRKDSPWSPPHPPSIAARLRSPPAPGQSPAARSSGTSRTPQLLVLGTIQMAGFMLVYRYVFGGAIQPDGIRYVNYLIPGFVTTGVLFAGIGAAVAVAEDLQQGFIDRLRSLPIPRSAVLAGRALADTVILIWSLGVTVALGFLVGFRLHGSVLDGLAAFGLVVLFGYVFEWLFITVGLFAGNAQAAQGFGLLVFPLTFVSSAYVPVDTMPSGLRDRR